MSPSEFRRDLYRGTAADYDAFRPPYPAALIEHLLQRVPRGGRLIDLACGTGQIAFAVHEHFADVWAVDQEADMISLARAKARDGAIENIRFIESRAEDLNAPEASCDLIAIGNAFHRLDRELVAKRALHWLRPGGCLALLWSENPWHGPERWQQAMAAVVDQWMRMTDGRNRIPPSYERERRELRDSAVLQQAGFLLEGKSEFPTERVWTIALLAGFVYSTSILSRRVLSGRTAEFEEDLRHALERSRPDGRFAQTIPFACELARRPAST